jgi:ankyrin repeat protein
LEKLLAGGADPNGVRVGKQVLGYSAQPPMYQTTVFYEADLRPHQRISLWRDRPHPLSSLSEAERDTRCTALHLATKSGNDRAVELLLDHDADINVLCKNLCDCKLIGPLNPSEAVPAPALVGPAWTPLHLAICHGHLSTAKLLMSRRASCKVCGWEGSIYGPEVTALHSASASGDVAMIDAILAHYRPNINTRDTSGHMPLRWAYETGQIEAMGFLLEYGADIDAACGSGRALLVHACAKARFKEAIW